MNEIPQPLQTNGTTDLCMYHSRKTVEHLFKGSSWALKMLDSTSKIPESFLMGNVFDFGNYEECLDVDVREDWGSFVGQHCLAIFTIRTSTLPGISQGTSGIIPALMSLCIPSTCIPEDLQYGLSKISKNFIVDPLLCHTRNRTTPFQTIDWIAIAVFAILGILVLLSTTYDIIVKDKEKHNRILLAFSWYSNGKSLLDTSSSEGALEPLHGIRFISICVIVLAHICAIASGKPTVNLISFVKQAKDWSHLYLGTFPFAVDTFFVVSGLLLSYVFMKVMDAGIPFNLPAFYFHRFLRVTPVLGAMILIHVSFLDRLGNGPIWDFAMTKTEKNYCIEHWWSTLLYVQNYVHLHEVCLTPSWFLAVDMQLYWISPAILLTLHKWPRIGLSLALGACLIGIVLSFEDAYVHEDNPNFISLGGPALGHNYYLTHTRYVPWLMGVVCGYIIHQTKKWRKRVAAGTDGLSKITVTCGWFLAAILYSGVYLSLRPFEREDYIYNGVEAAFYICLSRPLWSLFVIWVIFACVSGYGGVVNTILSWPVFRPLSRLSFCIYLIHFEVVFGRVAATRVPVYGNDLNMVTELLEDMVIIMLLAMVMTLTVEGPCICLEKVLFQKGSKKKPQTNGNSLQAVEVEMQGTVAKSENNLIEQDESFKRR